MVTHRPPWNFDNLLGAQRMKQIPVSNGRASALVDDEDYEMLSRNKWQIDLWGYAVRRVQIPGEKRGKRRLVFMHRLIMGLPSAKENPRHVDHIDRNSLNNQKSNLRICSTRENSRNRGVKSTNTSGYTGVFRREGESKWASAIEINGSKINIGRFDDPWEAHVAYCHKAVEIYGEYASAEVRAVVDSGSTYTPYIGRTNKTGVKGISYHHGRWIARIHLGGERVTLGRFASLEEAAEAYRDAEQRKAAEAIDSRDAA